MKPMSAMHSSTPAAATWGVRIRRATRAGPLEGLAPQLWLRRRLRRVYLARLQRCAASRLLASVGGCTRGVTFAIANGAPFLGEQAGAGVRATLITIQRSEAARSREGPPGPSAASRVAAPLTAGDAKLPARVPAHMLDGHRKPFESRHRRGIWHASGVHRPTEQQERAFIRAAARAYVRATTW
jgi:hypothetical protein